MSTFAAILLLVGFLTFVILVGFGIYWVGRLGVKQAGNMLGAVVIGSFMLLCVFVPVVSIGTPIVYRYVIVEGPLGKYIQELWNKAFSITLPGTLPTATPIGGIQTATPAQTGTSLPLAPTAALFTDVLVTFSCTPVNLVPGVTSVTLYQWSPTGTAVSEASTGLMAGGWTKEGWLLGCPPEFGLYFSPNQVDWREAGIVFPAQLEPTATPTVTPTATATVDVDALCQSTFVAWLDAGGLETTFGTDTVPNKMVARLKGPGFSALIPGKSAEEWIVTIPDWPDFPPFVIHGESANQIEGHDFRGQSTFIGTGTQCHAQSP